MFADIYSISIPILIVLCINGGFSEKCPFNSVCICQKFKGKLFADCSDKKLMSAPVFSDNVIGVNFSKNLFSEIPKTLPEKLLYLDISTNALVSLNHSSLTLYRSLQNLSLSNNKLDDIPIGTFQSNVQLRDLDVSFNMELTIEVIYNISLDLKNSTIQKLNFEKIQCTYGVSQILKIDHVINLKYTQLQELNVASNRIHSLELGLLSLLPKSLRVINVADNVLSFGFYLMEVSSLGRLEILNASFQHSFHQVDFHNFFDKKCNDTRKPSCNCLNFYKLLAPVPNELSIGVLNYTLYLPRNAKKIYIHDNLLKVSIREFPFSPNNRLTHIFAQNNIVYELIGPFTGLLKLQYLDLSGNFCKFINKKFFQHFPSLRFLNLSNNALSQTFRSDDQGELFMNLRHLSNLDLSWNRIAHLSEQMLRNNINLQILNLSFNAMSKFNVEIVHMTKLSILDLSNNQLVQLNLETRSALNQMQTDSIDVHLIGNNLICSCETLDFLKWMHNSKKIHFVQKRNYTCSFGTKTSVLFDELDTILQQLEKKCSSYTLIIVLMTILIIVIMTTTVSRILYRFRWKLRYMYYVAKEKYKGEANHIHIGGQMSFRFDAFISYADEDRDIVIDLVNYLEKHNGLSLCIHNRDFIPGTGIADNITNAIHCSKRTVCFMTKHFLDSYWCMFELNMARMEAMYSRSGQNVLFLVALQKGIMKQLPLQLMDLVDSHSYLDFPEEKSDVEGSETVVAFRVKLGETLTTI
uniref:Toll-like receptor 2 n=1 Tax=Crassostrea virginica TaxID=6565 RepID=A0A8B8BYE3_CRAVI|nr:toll-like receptor 2 [Crassostrea virginica]